MTIFNPASPGFRVMAEWDGIRACFYSQRGLISAGLIAGIDPLVGWMWLGTTAVLPLLYALPCAAMMVMCMKGQSSSAAGRVGGPGEAEGNPDPGLPR